jgi:hypothetical protein
MPSASAPAQDFAGRGYLETFRYCLPGFVASGASHTDSLSLEEREQSRAHDGYD